MNGSWSIYIQTPTKPGTYQIIVKAGDVIQIIYITLEENKNDNKSIENNPRSLLFYIFPLLIITILLLIFLILRRKSFYFSNKNNESDLQDTEE